MCSPLIYAWELYFNTEFKMSHFFIFFCSISLYNVPKIKILENRDFVKKVKKKLKKSIDTQDKNMILYPSCQRDKIKTDSNNTFLKHKKLNKNIKKLRKNA